MVAGRRLVDVHGAWEANVSLVGRNRGGPPSPESWLVPFVKRYTRWLTCVTIGSSRTDCIPRLSSGLGRRKHCVKGSMGAEVPTVTML